jgi:hypothetical protein
MRTRQVEQLRALEGRQVGLALRDGSRIDDCQLIAAGRSRPRTVWVFVEGRDTFLRLDQVVDLWEVIGDADPGERPREARRERIDEDGLR